MELRYLETANPVLTVKGLEVCYYLRRGVVRAVRGVDFTLEKQEMFGLVGESGSGKSTIAWAIMNLVRWPGRIVKGEILYHERNLLKKGDKELRSIRGSEISIITQSTRGGLNPLLTIGAQIKNVYQAHARVSDRTARHRTVEMLNMMFLPDPERVARCYPHEISGGMAQRVVIAMALICSPKIVICDEPTTGLDLTVQIQILDLIKSLVQRFDTSTLIVSHDLGVVAQYCQRIGVLKDGELLEISTVEDFFNGPSHPYSIALLEAVSLDRIKAKNLV
jgi:ABC-type dipeptide/oligopeptide/nickel transport system ATPase component